ncbi:hypothetical protein TKK_0015655 [Trichogramma kaykai]
MWDRLLGVPPINDAIPVERKYQLAYDRIKNKRTRRADKVNEKRGNCDEFLMGDKVLIKCKNSSDQENKILAKFMQIYEGPYIIKSTLGENTYLLEDSNSRVKGQFHVNDLIQYKRKVDKSTNTQAHDVAIQAQGPAELAQRAWVVNKPPLPSGPRGLIVRTKPRRIGKKRRGKKMPNGKATQTEKPFTSEAAVQVRREELMPLMGPQVYPPSPGDSSDDEFFFVLPEDYLPSRKGIRSAGFKSQLSEEFEDMWREIGEEICGVARRGQ